MKGTVAMTARKMATPPSIAVGLRCQRSFFGMATLPKRRANARTIGVAIAADANAATVIRHAFRGNRSTITGNAISYSM
jgi:hypothetical protein